MKKKVLMLSAKANMIQQFNHRNITILQKLGCEVHVATNLVDFGSMSSKENEKLKRWMKEKNIVVHQVDFGRRMGTIKSNLHAINQLREIFKKNNFIFVHVHSPLGSILGRLVAAYFKVPSIYTAHGYHFFKNGPKSSWLFFYPLEWIFSFITSTLITINEEDYQLSQKHMHAKNIIKINGVGVEVRGSWKITEEEKINARQRLRRELGVPPTAFLISSVGELSNRKNHRIVLESLKKFSPEELKNIYYVIAGSGETGNELKKIAHDFNFDDHFQLLGYRSDIHNLNYASDISMLPSLREGLGIAGLDATVDGTYILASNTGGITDYVKENVNGNLFSPYDSEMIKRLIQSRINANNKVDHHEWLLKFDTTNVDKKMIAIYRGYTREK